MNQNSQVIAKQYGNNASGVQREEEIALERKEETGVIMEAYGDMVYHLALSQTKNIANAEDVYQEVFIKYFKVNKVFRNDIHVKAWLIRVTINLCKDLRGSAWARHTAPLDENLVSEEEESGSEVYQIVLSLPPKYRAVVHLFYYEEMTTAEISKVLKIREGSVSSRLSRARAMLKEKLKGEYDYEGF